MNKHLGAQREAKTDELKKLERVYEHTPKCSLVEEARNKNYSKPRRLLLSKSSKVQILFLALTVQNCKDYSNHQEFNVFWFTSPRVITEIISKKKKVQSWREVLFMCKTAEI
jgi:hypothetical protein